MRRICWVTQDHLFLQVPPGQPHHGQLMLVAAAAVYNNLESLTNTSNHMQPQQHQFTSQLQHSGSAVSTSSANLHDDQRPYACQFCTRRFKRRDHLVNHTRLHTGEKPYVCDKCGKGFAQLHGLQYHSVNICRFKSRIPGAISDLLPPPP